jgi:hypothetical protein
MKCPHHGIYSTQPKITMNIQVPPFPVAQIAPTVLPLLDAVPVYPGLTYRSCLKPNLIAMDDDKSIANIFCFGAFADRNSGIIYRPHRLVPVCVFQWKYLFLCPLPL